MNIEMYLTDIECINLFKKDIIHLCETWCTEDIGNIPVVLMVFEYCKSHASRNFIKERTSGGFLIFWRRNKISDFKVVMHSSSWVFIFCQVVKRNLLLGAVYLKSGENDSVLDVLTMEVNNMVATLQQPVVLISGEFNARTAILNSLENDVFKDLCLTGVRKSLDLVVCKNGAYLVELMDSLGLSVCNSRLTGNVLANFTFESQTGFSKIDLVLVSFGALPFVNDFMLKIWGMCHFLNTNIVLIKLNISFDDHFDCSTTWAELQFLFWGVTRLPEEDQIGSGVLPPK